jgi:hypothetical protein
MPTSYSRRMGDFLYDIEVSEAVAPPPRRMAGDFALALSTLFAWTPVGP